MFILIFAELIQVQELELKCSNVRTHKYTNTTMCFMGNFWLGPEGIFVKGRGISQELLESQNYSTAARIDPKLSNDFPVR